MASACYDPAAAIGLWQRMEASQSGKEGKASSMQSAKSKGRLASFVSTHPSHADRIEKIKEWLPEAYACYEAASPCDQRRQLGAFFKGAGL